MINEANIDDYVWVEAAACPHPEATSCMSIVGDSMEPILPDGTVVAIDASIRRLDVLVERMVAVRDPDDAGVTIKTLMLHGDRAVFRAANRAHPDLIIPAARVEDEGLIVGKVIWWRAVAK